MLDLAFPVVVVLATIGLVVFRHRCFRRAASVAQERRQRGEPPLTRRVGTRVAVLLLGAVFVGVGIAWSYGH
jgi:hypothetical protein